MKLGKAVVKGRVLILVVALLLLIPSVFGMIFTRVNYDMLNYLPDTLDTVKGQKYMLEDFGKGAFSFLIFEDMDDRQISAVADEIKEVDHVADVLAYSDVTDGSVPAELLPDDVYHAFNADSDTLVAVFFDTSGSADETMDAIGKIRAIAGKSCLVSGISAMVTDLRDLCEREEAVYVAIAVVLAVAAMLLFLDNWLIPFVFLAGIGISILLNLGSNFFLGEISYITKALSAVLQLAVTMDYSIFLWHSYGEHKQHCADHEEAMALAIKETFASVIGSSVTTVAGFIALCFLLYDLYARTRPRHRHGKGRAAGCARLRDRAACHDPGARQAARQDHAQVADPAGKKARVGRGQNFSRLFDTLCRAGGACLLRLQQDQRRGLLRPVAQSAGGYAQRDCQQQAGKGVCHGQHPHGAGQRQAAVRRRAAYAGGI